jgi:hypothetical protein
MRGIWEEASYEFGEVIDSGTDNILTNSRLDTGGKASGADVEFNYWTVSTFRNGKAVRFEWFAARAEALEAARLRSNARPTRPRRRLGSVDRPLTHPSSVADRVPAGREGQLFVWSRSCTQTSTRRRAGRDRGVRRRGTAPCRSCARPTAALGADGPRSDPVLIAERSDDDREHPERRHCDGHRDGCQ